MTHRPALAHYARQPDPLLRADQRDALITARDLLLVLSAAIFGAAAVFGLPWLLALWCVGLAGPDACF